MNTRPGYKLDGRVPIGHKLAGRRNLDYFGNIPVGGHLTANQWGHGEDVRFVKRDERTATEFGYFKRNGGHPKRGWAGRTQFRKRDIVVHHRRVPCST